MGRLHTKLTALACLLEHPLWWLAGSVEVAAANGPTEASTAVQCGVTGSAVEVDRSERGCDGEFYFFWAGCERESEYVITSGGDVSVRTDARVESLSI
jgi:hypothetical protein